MFAFFLGPFRSWESATALGSVPALAQWGKEFRNYLHDRAVAGGNLGFAIRPYLAMRLSQVSHQTARRCRGWWTFFFAAFFLAFCFAAASAIAAVLLSVANGAYL